VYLVRHPDVGYCLLNGAPDDIGASVRSVYATAADALTALQTWIASTGGQLLSPGRRWVTTGIVDGSDGFAG
jgi:hypothetical protein